MRNVFVNSIIHLVTYLFLLESFSNDRIFLRGSVIVDKKSVQEDDSSRVGCPIHDPRHTISTQNKRTLCTTYGKWIQGTKEHIFEPTENQLSYWNYIGGQKIETSYNRRRRKRQSDVTADRRDVRRDYRTLSDVDRASFHAALNGIKNTLIDGMSIYDLFVAFHQANMAPGAHFGPAFLPFHREMLFRFENSLKEINESVSVPYWDTTLDDALGNNAINSVMWTERFVGNGHGDVTTGPFAGWTLPFTSQGRNVLFRNLSAGVPFQRTTPGFLTDQTVGRMMNASRLRELSWFVDAFFEGRHGAVHNWVGGPMADLPNSPADPVFWLHHSFIDCLWEDFRDRQRSLRPPVDPRYDYPNDSVVYGVNTQQPDGRMLRRAADSAHYSTNTMEPFGPLRNIDGLSDEYTGVFYRCAGRPRCPDCGSTNNLFCSRRINKCVPKLRLFADCSSFQDDDSCFDGVCCRGTCQRSCESVPPIRSDGPFNPPTSRSDSSPDETSRFRFANTVPTTRAARPSPVATTSPGVRGTEATSADRNPEFQQTTGCPQSDPLCFNEFNSIISQPDFDGAAQTIFDLIERRRSPERFNFAPNIPFPPFPPAVEDQDDFASF